VVGCAAWRRTPLHTTDNCTALCRVLGMLLPVALAVLLMGSIAVTAQPTPVSVDDAPTPAESYTLSGGIGAMSTAGTSRLLKDYDEPMRSEILDYLFKPNWGASMHHLKVALGGDGETTCGSEPTTMRNATAENYLVGYEMWLMSEAKKRNPDILLYGLPLSFPAWVGNGTASPYSDVQATASYVRKWCAGAKSVWNLTIDYIGLWNERPTTKAYVMELRKQLDAHSLHNVKIVGNDATWDPIAQEVLSDAELRSAVSVLSAHYPGTKSSPNAQTALKEYGIPLWNVEEYSTFSDETGALCWIRCVVDDYVNGFMTMTSSWHLIGT
jgi:galactosylceramidase